MRFDKAKDPAACAAKDSGRYAVAGVAIVQRPDGSTFLAATDGRMLSMVRAQPDDGDDMPAILGQGRVYPPAAFAARRACKRRDTEASVILNGSAYVRADGCTTEYARVDHPFPDVLGVTPAGKPVLSLNLNAELLARMQKALGGNAVRIEIHAIGDDAEIDPSLPLTVRPIYLEGPASEDGSFGLVMPLRGD